MLMILTSPAGWSPSTETLLVTYHHTWSGLPQQHLIELEVNVSTSSFRAFLRDSLTRFAVVQQLFTTRAFFNKGTGQRNRFKEIPATTSASPQRMVNLTCLLNDNLAAETFDQEIISPYLSNNPPILSFDNLATEGDHSDLYGRHIITAH